MLFLTFCNMKEDCYAQELFDLDIVFVRPNSSIIQMYIVHTIKAK